MRNLKTCPVTAIISRETVTTIAPALLTHRRRERSTTCLVQMPSVKDRLKMGFIPLNLTVLSPFRYITFKMFQFAHVSKCSEIYQKVFPPVHSLHNFFCYVTVYLLPCTLIYLKSKQSIDQSLLLLYTNYHKHITN